MKSKKSVLAIVLGVLMVIMLVACSKSEDVSLIGKWKLDMDDYYEKVRASGVSDEQIQEIKEMEMTVIEEYTEDGERIRITTRENAEDNYDMEDWNYEIIDGRIAISEHGSERGYIDFKIKGRTLELTYEGVTLRYTRVK